MGKATLFRHHVYCYLWVVLLANILLIAGFSALYLVQTQRLQEGEQELTSAIISLLHLRVQQSHDMLLTLEPEVRDAAGDLEAVQRLINTHVTRAGYGLRIAWTDAEKILRVGTLVGLFGVGEGRATPEIDLSHRDYIQSAESRPGQVVTGGVHAHAVTGRPFFAFALGVEDAEGNYLGTLASITDVTQLQKLLHSIVADSYVALRVSLPNGDELFAHQASLASKPWREQKTQGLTVESAVTFTALVELRQKTLTQFFIWVGGANIVLLLVGWLAYRMYVKPLQQLAATFLTLPAHLASDKAWQGDDVGGMIHRAKHITDLLVLHHGGQLESKAQRDQLRKAIAQIDHLNEEQLTFFSTVGAEMEETFLAIRRYAGFLEGGLDEDYYHTDTTFLENLKEAAQNLKFLSNAFYLMCLQKSGGYQGKREALSLQKLASHTALLFEDALEFRQITLHGLGDDEREQLIEQDTAIVRHVLWGVFFLLMRYADDSANIHFIIRQAENGVRLNADVSACLPGHIASMDEEMSTFFPETLNPARLLEEAISSHVDFMVADHLLRYFCESTDGLEIYAETRATGAVGFTLGFSLPSQNDAG